MKVRTRMGISVRTMVKVTTEVGRTKRGGRRATDRVVTSTRMGSGVGTMIWGPALVRW